MLLCPGESDVEEGGAGGGGRGRRPGEGDVKEGGGG